jgi:hypothetical protein
MVHIVTAALKGLSARRSTSIKGSISERCIQYFPNSLFGILLTSLALLINFQCISGSRTVKLISSSYHHMCNVTGLNVFSVSEIGRITFFLQPSLLTFWLLYPIAIHTKWYLNLEIILILSILAVPRDKLGRFNRF